MRLLFFEIATRPTFLTDCTIQTGECTHLEAVIISSALSKCSIPRLHAATAVVRIAGMDYYSGANIIFLRTLIDKKYTLPFQAVVAVVEYFIKLVLTIRVRMIIYADS